MIGNSLEFAQTQPLNKLCDHMIALVLNRDRMFEMKNGPAAGLDLLRRPPWTMLFPQGMLVSVPCYGRRPC